MPLRRMLITQLDRTLLYRWTLFNCTGIAIGVAVAMVTAAGCWFSGRASEASQYVQVPAELGVALTGLNAAQWLIRMNDICRAWRDCLPVQQPAGGKACAFTLWTQLSPTPPEYRRSSEKEERRKTRGCVTLAGKYR